MKIDELTIEEKCINTIRFLSVDAIQKANSGHPGITMGSAPIAYLLYSKIMKYNPKDPTWINRDRFVLSAGHGSMLLYSILHLSGYNISIEDIKKFRQWGSITPGHPENDKTPGVETTTGPLGQGIANAVGMAVASKFHGAKFNKPNYKLFDHNIFALAGDGDMMEGISHEAASFAGHHKLDNLIVFYDNNTITIEGKTSLTFSDETKNRFESYGWYVQHVKDVNDLEALETATKAAEEVKDKPSLVIVDTVIGYGSPNKSDTPGVHGSPLGDDEIKLTKENLGWDPGQTFFVPEEVKEHFGNIKQEKIYNHEDWQRLLVSYQMDFPEESKLLAEIFNKDFGDDWKNHLPVFDNYDTKIATRSISGKVINSIKDYLPTMIGGSADLAPSNNTLMSEEENFSSENYSGRNMHFGIREHGMAAIMNGMELYGGLISYGATFLIFSDYLRPAIRLAALSEIRPIYIFTHDSVGVGEDGPTHQPVEQLASLRAIPGLTVLRPCDANETVFAWQVALETKNKPVAILLTRQKLPVLDRTKYAAAENTLKGAYIIYETNDSPQIILIASGSEVNLILDAATQLEKDGKSVRCVSFPSWELFEKQSDDYKKFVFLPNVLKRVAVEAGVSLGWEKYVGLDGKIISIDKFGTSAPGDKIFEEYGISVNNIISVVNQLN